LESLEKEELVIEGLDVDAALQNSISRGEQIKRRRRLIRVGSFVSGVVLVLGIGALFATLAFADSDKPAAVRSAEEVSTAPTTTAPIITTTQIPQVQDKPIVSQEVVVRKF